MQVYETSPKKPRNCNIKLQNLTFTRKKKTHFEEKKALKNTFPQETNRSKGPVLIGLEEIVQG